ncbi:MAG: pyrroline-5-carboxylate reductase [Syntrophomonadaceae bacterium]
MNFTLGMVGCGKMAYALVRGLAANSQVEADKILVNDIDINRVDIFTREFGAQGVSLPELLTKCDMVILAVKPQHMQMVLTEAAGLWKPGQKIVSIAAGITTTQIEDTLGLALPVVRVMPNTPCLINKGVMAVCGGRYASDHDVHLVMELISNLGLPMQTAEKNMDAVTALSGSGPAYVYLVAEAMINAGVYVGLDHDLARTLVLQTIMGSAAMLLETREHPAVLRDQVCSPGGTTMAGVQQLENNGLRKAFFSAIKAACDRSRELGKD